MTFAPKKIFDPAIWVDEYGNFLYAYAFSRVRDESVAEDLVQETLLAAMQSQNKFEAKSAEKTWLCGILKHKIVDYFRKSSREVELTDEEADMSSYDYLFREEGVWKDHWTAESRPIVWNENPEKMSGKQRISRNFNALFRRIAGKSCKLFYFARNGWFRFGGNLRDFRNLAE